MAARARSSVWTILIIVLLLAVIVALGVAFFARAPSAPGVDLAVDLPTVPTAPAVPLPVVPDAPRLPDAPVPLPK